MMRLSSLEESGAAEPFPVRSDAGRTFHHVDAR